MAVVSSLQLSLSLFTSARVTNYGSKVGYISEPNLNLPSWSPLKPAKANPNGAPNVLRPFVGLLERINGLIEAEWARQR